MALSTKTRKILTVSMANKVAAKELADAVDSGSNPQAATVAAFGATTNLTAAAVAPTTFVATTGTYAVPATPTGAEVDTVVDGALAKVKAVVDIKADNADLETLRGEVETRLDNIESKINAIIVAMKAAGLMAP